MKKLIFASALLLSACGKFESQQFTPSNVTSQQAQLTLGESGSGAETEPVTASIAQSRANANAESVATAGTVTASLAQSGSEFGSTNGKAGGPCSNEILRDYQQSQVSCPENGEGSVENCIAAMNVFSARHPHVNCQTDDGNGGILTVENATANGEG